MRRDPLLDPLHPFVDDESNRLPSSDQGSCVAKAFASLRDFGFIDPPCPPQRPLILIGLGGSASTREAIVKAAIQRGHPVVVAPRDLIEEEPPKIADLLRTQLNLKRMRTERSKRR